MNFPSEVNFWTRWLRNSLVYTSSFLLIAIPTHASNSPSPLPRCPHFHRNRGAGRFSSLATPQAPEIKETHPAPAQPRKCLREGVSCCQPLRLSDLIGISLYAVVIFDVGSLNCIWLFGFSLFIFNH